MKNTEAEQALHSMKNSVQRVFVERSALVECAARLGSVSSAKMNLVRQAHKTASDLALLQGVQDPNGLEASATEVAVLRYGGHVQEGDMP